MDAYRGSLSHFCMHLLVPALLDRPTLAGRIRVSRGTVTREFLIENGAVVGQSSSAPGEHLGQVLHSMGLLEAERAAAAFEQAQATGLPFADYLVSHGLLSRDELDAAFCNKAREAFFDCYDWETGELAFQPGRVPGGGLRFRLPLAELHRDALNARQEWRTFRGIFPDPQAHFRGDPSRLGGDFVDDDLLLVSLAEAGASLTELLQSGRGHRRSTARRLVVLYRKGALASKRSEDANGRVALLMSDAERALAQGRFDHAARLANIVLEHGPIPQAHTLLQRAEDALTQTLANKLQHATKRPTLLPLPSPAPRELTVDDLVLYARLQRGGAIGEVIRSAPMGERGAYHAVWRLVRTGVLKLDDRVAPAR